MKDKKCLLYPFTDKSYVIIKGMINLGIDVDVISSIGSGYVGKSIGYSVNKNNPRKTAKSINDIDFKEYDVIIIPENFEYDHQKEEIKVLLDKIHQHKLKVCYFGERINPFKHERLDIENINTNRDIINYIENSKDLSSKPLFKPQVPIIYIGELLETQDSLDIGLGLKIELEKQGYTCSLISQNADAMIFGSFTYPSNFMGNQCSAEEQIVSFNRWVGAIDYNQKPDLIIFDVPKGIMQYGGNYHNSFGIYAQMMAVTLEPDFLILTVTKDNVEEIQLDVINTHLGGKLGRIVDMFHLTNSVFDIPPNNSTEPDKPLYIKENKINNILNNTSKKYENKFKNLSSNDEIVALVDSIINKFS